MKELTRCPICESSRILFAFSAPTTRQADHCDWAVYECSECTHQFMNPQPSWQELAPYYNASYAPYDPMHGSIAEDNQAIERARDTGKLRHVSVRPGTRVLDVGCGGGWFLRIAKKLGAIEQGVEPSRHGVETARGHGLRTFHGTLENFAEQHPDAQFDLITANHVIEHVPEPVATLRVMKQLLAPGGMIWISVPNAAYPLCRALKGRWHSSDLPYHLMHFSPASMALAGQLAGLSVRHQGTESLPDCVASSMRLYLRYRWKLPRRMTDKVKLVDTIAQGYAKQRDAEINGEAILTDFIAAGD